MTYKPEPTDLSNIVFSEELQRMLTDVIGPEVHDTWAAARIREGWQYAPGIKDPEKKTTPMLVPYDELPQSEKDYDLATARQAIGLLLANGWKLIPPEK